MFKISDLYLLSPQFGLVIVALAVMMVDLFVKRRVVTMLVALVGLILLVGLTVSLALSGHLAKPQLAFWNMLSVDQYSLFFDMIFLLTAAVIVLATYNYAEKYIKADGEFYTLLLFSVTGMMFMASTTELITIYISLELASIPLYVMAGLIRDNARSAEAAVKYVLLGAMSSAILLYGFALLYGLTGTTDLAGIANAIHSSIKDGNMLVLVASVLVLAGFGFKISAVPFHMWAPDIYEGAPTPATAFFSVGSKAAGFAALIRVFMFGGLWQVNNTALVTIVAIVAILTMTLGNFVAAVQINVKRMMAYSSIAQAGYILVAFASSLAGKNADGNTAVLFYLFVYALTNLGAFAGIIALANATGGEKIEDFRGLAKRAPLLSAATALCLLSLGGIPPMAGFIGKVLIFTTAWGNGLAYLAVIALINSIVSLVYYGRIVKSMYFDAPLRESDHVTTPAGLSAPIAVMAAALIIVTFATQIVLAAANPAANTLLGFLAGR